jgi:xanthine dehydrogenase accessory factor
LPAATLKKMAALCAARQPLRITFDAQSGVAGQLESGLSDKDRQASFLEDDDAFTLYYPPPPHLILIGAVHISQHLAQMAAQCGFEVSIIDPRGIFTSDARFPETVRIYKSWPSEILDRLPLDRATAMVTLTHDPKIDDDGLLPALASPCFILLVWAVSVPMLSAKKGLQKRGLHRTNLPELVGLRVWISGQNHLPKLPLLFWQSS